MQRKAMKPRPNLAQRAADLLEGLGRVRFGRGHGHVHVHHPGPQGGVHDARVEIRRHGIHDQVELLAAVGDGVLISSVSGLHSGVNAVSGDFSAGAEGLRIRDGAMAEPLREFTIASTLQRMISEVGEVGSDIEWLPMRAAGVSLVVGDVTVSGLS